MDTFAETLLKELIHSLPQVFAMIGNFKSQLASEGLKLIFLPFHEFSLVSCIVAIGWVAIFWKNKGLLVSVVSHTFHVTEWFAGVFKRI